MMEPSWYIDTIQLSVSQVFMFIWFDIVNMSSVSIACFVGQVGHSTALKLAATNGI